MGMSSSQARLLSLTGRMHDIERKAQKLEAQKLQMANESARAYDEYLLALEDSKIQYKSLNNDGSIAYRDVNLAILENGAVTGYTGETSPKTFLIQNARTNEIYVTPEFAAEYGITGNNGNALPSLEDYLTQEGCTKAEKMQTVPDYTNVTSVNPVDNRVATAPGQVTVNDPDTYSINGTLVAPVDNSVAATTSYNVSGIAPSVASTNSVTTPLYKDVVTTGVDASANVASSSTSSTTTINQSILTINPNTQTYSKLDKQVITVDVNDLNKTISQLFPGMNFDDAATDIDDTFSTTYGNTLNFYYYTENNGVNNHFQDVDDVFQIQYTADTTIDDLFQWVEASTNGAVVYDPSAGTLTSTNGTFRFYSNDDVRFDQVVSNYLKQNTAVTWKSASNQVTNNTTMIDYLYSDECYTNTGYAQTSIYIKDVESGSYLTTTYSGSTALRDVTYNEYLSSIANNSELRAAGYNYTTDATGKWVISMDGDYEIKFLNMDGALEKIGTKDNNTAIEINRNAIAENIYLARSVINETTTADYNANHDAQIANILNEMQGAYGNYSTNENKRQLLLFSEQLSAALVSGDNTQIQTALAKLGTTIVSENYKNGTQQTQTTNGNLTTTLEVATTYSFNFNDSNAAIVPNEKEVEDGFDFTPGTLNVNGTNAEIEKYLAYQLYQNDNTKSYEQYLASIQGQNYNAYQLAEIVENFNTHKANLSNGTNISAQLTKYSAATHTLTQNATGYNVVNNSTAPVYEVTCANTDDILDRLAFDIYTKKGTGNPNTIKTQLSNIFDRNQLASLSSYYGRTEWNTIVESLSNTMTANSVSSYANKYVGYTVNALTSNDVTISTVANSHVEDVKGKLNIPTIQGIASNLVVAFNEQGYNVTETEIQAALNNLYGTDTQVNNQSLANINQAVFNYLSGSGSSAAEMNNIYNNLFNGQALSVAQTWSANTYEISRANLGTCTANYGTKEVGTGVFEWVKDQHYQETVARWNELKALEGFTYVIVSPELAVSSDFVNNLLTNNEAIVLEFSPQTQEMIQTSVATNTSLREVDDEKNLKKAEAEYEANMRKIDMKDRKYDQDLAALDTERNAVKQEMETLKTVVKENVDRTFKLFS